MVTRRMAEILQLYSELQKRNCSSKATSCLKIISRNELSQLGTATPTDATSTIEGRCAFTEHECAEQAGQVRVRFGYLFQTKFYGNSATKITSFQCVSEPPVTRFGITIHERRCCSSEDLSNDATTAKFSIKFLCFILFIVLSPFSL